VANHGGSLAPLPDLDRRPSKTETKMCQPLYQNFGLIINLVAHLSTGWNSHGTDFRQQVVVRLFGYKRYELCPPNPNG